MEIFKGCYLRGEGRAMLFLKQKKNLLILTGIILALVGVSVLSLANREKAKTFFELTGLDASRTFKLCLVDGATLKEVVVEEEETVVQFFEIMSSLEFYPERELGRQPAWSYGADLYQAEDRFTRVVFAGKQIQFQDFYRGENQSFVVKPGPCYSVNKEVGEEIGRLFAAAVAARMEMEEKEEEEEEESGPVFVEEIFPAIAVVYDNHPSARPSSGLQKADIVYEFLVEGGTTRYLAIFKTLHQENFNIGPIRSLRPYFAVQSLEYGGLVVHSGYSARTEQMIRGLGLTQITDYSYFWRDTSRQAPHNLYTNINNLYRAAGEKPKAGKKTLMPQSKPQEPYEKGEIIEIDYSAINKVRYDYDADKRVYYRSVNGEPHTERESKEQYYANRVIVRITPHTDIPGTDLVDIDLEGSGRGYLYELGRKTAITWKKVGHETIFCYPGGDPILPIKGTTWIQIVRN